MLDRMENIAPFAYALVYSGAGYYCRGSMLPFFLQNVHVGHPVVSG